MTKPFLDLFRCTLLSFCILTALSISAFANPIEAEHRLCTQDTDCKIIYTGCSCLCGYEHIDTVNQKYVEQFKDLEKCTKNEIKICAEAGACAIAKLPSALCQNQTCVIAWTPARH